MNFDNKWWCLVLFIWVLIMLTIHSAYPGELNERRFCIEVPEDWSIPKITCFSVPSQYYEEIKSLPPSFVGHWAPENKKTGVRFLFLGSPTPCGHDNEIAWTIYFGRWNNVLMIARGRKTIKPEDVKDGLSVFDQCWTEDDNGDLFELNHDEIKAMHESWRKWIPT